MEEDTETEMRAMRRQLLRGREGGRSSLRTQVWQSLVSVSRFVIKVKVALGRNPDNGPLQPPAAGPRTNVHTQTDAVCSKLLRLSASKPE